MVNAVVFDLFETLITETANRPLRASHLGDHFGVDAELFKAAWQRQRPQVVRGQLTFRQALRGICATLMAPTHDSAVDRVCEQRRAEKTRLFSRVDRRVAPLLDALSARHLKLGIISNCFAEDVEAWPTWPAAYQFDVVVFSHRVRLAKPDISIYQLTMEQLGVRPESTLFVGDGGDDELAGAERAGILAVRAAWFVMHGPTGAGRPGLRHPAEVLRHV